MSLRIDWNGMAEWARFRGGWGLPGLAMQIKNVRITLSRAWQEGGRPLAPAVLIFPIICTYAGLALQQALDVTGSVDDMHDLDSIASRLIENQPVFEAFHWPSANAAKNWTMEGA